MKVQEITAKSVLNPSKILDFCLNPYTGCAISCKYCYARLFMKRYSGHHEPWGAFVDVKVNAPELLKKQLLRAKRGSVWISSVCDPYQPLEAKYRLTRRCLVELLEHQFPVFVQTKSKLVLRDLDLFKKFHDIEVVLMTANMKPFDDRPNGATLGSA
jgi:DNA repair photolyase